MDDLLNAIQDRGLRQACLTWLARAPDPGHLPTVDALDPVAFMSLLGRLSVIEVERYTEVCRFRYRLQGVAVPLRTGPMTGEWGRDWTGRYLDQIQMPQFVATATDWYLGVVRACRPARRVMAGDYDGYELQSYEVLALPWGAGQRVERLLIATRPLRPDAAALWAAGAAPTSLDLYHAALGRGQREHVRGVKMELKVGDRVTFRKDSTLGHGQGRIGQIGTVTRALGVLPGQAVAHVDVRFGDGEDLGIAEHEFERA